MRIHQKLLQNPLELEKFIGSDAEKRKKKQSLNGTKRAKSMESTQQLDLSEGAVDEPAELSSPQTATPKVRRKSSTHSVSKGKSCQTKQNMVKSVIQHFRDDNR